MDSKFSVSCVDNNLTSATARCAENGFRIGLLQLPQEILEKVLTYLTFDEISACRQVLHRQIPDSRVVHIDDVWRCRRSARN